MGLLLGLSAAVTELSLSQERVLVGIDGPDGAGKTTMADNLAEALETPTLRASIDSFHRPREQRYQRGELSATATTSTASTTQCCSPSV